MPRALFLGMTVSEFWESNPRIMNAYELAHKDTIKEQNLMNFYLGQYMISAIYASVGNMFKDKGSPRIHYEKQPFDIYQETITLHENMSEEEKMQYTDKLWDDLDKYFRDFNRKHGLPDPEDD